MIETNPDQSSGPNGVRPDPDRINDVQKSMTCSLYAESMVSSIGAQLTMLPDIQDLAGMVEAQGECPCTCYYRLIAKGCLERLAAQDWHETVLSSYVRSLYLARHHDRLKRGHMMEAKRAAPATAKSALENWIQWLDNAEGYLQEAMVHSQKMIGSRSWARLSSKSNEKPL
ncbi:hypothetical protein [Salinithrix halophila]|uniref:Uncharacterized protein n=1 Tax=Salinithrix halophila TaxID=1485204 RepID=A0ABV8JGB7_9BACL